MGPSCGVWECCRGSIQVLGLGFRVDLCFVGCYPGFGGWGWLDDLLVGLNSPAECSSLSNQTYTPTEKNSTVLSSICYLIMGHRVRKNRLYLYLGAGSELIVRIFMVQFTKLIY